MQPLFFLITWNRDSDNSWFLQSLARLIFAGTLLFYFWGSAATKLGDGIFGFLFPSIGAYAQILPRTAEALGYDLSKFGFFHWLVVAGGTNAEFILPFLVAIGLFTRFAALGMIGFVVVQSYVDIVGHGLDDKSIGTWFDRLPDAIIFDQRAFWVFLLLVLMVKGGGPASVDNVLLKNFKAPA